MLGLLATITVGYRPILDPLPLDSLWPWLLAPPVVAVAVVYKAIKMNDLRGLVRQAWRMAVQIMAFVVIAGLVLWALTEWW